MIYVRGLKSGCGCVLRGVGLRPFDDCFALRWTGGRRIPNSPGLDPYEMSVPGHHRPRNVGWARAAGLLYGDWGTSKAYVIGAAFLVSDFGSLPTILAVCALTGLVAYNYVIVCKHFPDGGGFYSSAR